MIFEKSSKIDDFYEVKNMFQVIDGLGHVYDAYGTFLDEDGDIQFILCDDSGEFFKTDLVEGFYKLYKETDLK